MLSRIIKEIPWLILLALIISLTIYAPWELTRIILRDHIYGDLGTLPKYKFILEIVFFNISYILAIILIGVRIKKRNQ